MRYGTNYLSLSLLRILSDTDMEKIAEKECIKIDRRDNSHYVYSTPDMPREDMIACLKINTAAFRLLSSIDIRNRMKIRDMYFNVKDKLRITNIEILKYFSEQFYEYLNNKDVDYVKEDFPDAEMYYSRNIHNDIPDEWIIKRLECLLRQ